MLHRNHTTEPHADHLVSMRETRLILGGVARGTVRKLVADGALPCVKIGARVLFRRADLTHFIVSATHRGDKA